METTKVNIKALLPEQVITTLITVGEYISKDCWTVGDLDILVQGVLKEKEYVVGKEEVHIFVASYVGLSSRTVRLYSDIADFFGEEVRQRFGALPFSHFTCAYGYRGREVEVLEISLRQMDVNGGRAPAVDWLNYTMQQTVSLTPPTNPPLPVWEQDAAALTETLAGAPDDPADVDPGSAPPTRKDMHYLSQYLVKVVQALLKMAGHLSVTPALSNRFMVVVSELEDVVNEIAGELSSDD